jgi:hypothetical protein
MALGRVCCSGTPRSPPARTQRPGRPRRPGGGCRRGTPERRWRRTGRPQVLATPPLKLVPSSWRADPLDRRHRTIGAGLTPGDPRLIFGLYEPGPIVRAPMGQHVP